MLSNKITQNMKNMSSNERFDFNNFIENLVDLINKEEVDYFSVDASQDNPIVSIKYSYTRQSFDDVEIDVLDADELDRFNESSAENTDFPLCLTHDFANDILNSKDVYELHDKIVRFQAALLEALLISSDSAITNIGTADLDVILAEVQFRVLSDFDKAEKNIVGICKNLSESIFERYLNDVI